MIMHDNIDTPEAGGQYEPGYVRPVTRPVLHQARLLSTPVLKVLRDLTSNIVRTLLVVLSIAVGVFAVGAVIHAQEVMSRDLAVSYATIAPADIILTTAPFDDTLVQAAENTQGVAGAEGRRTVSARLRVGDDWRDLLLIAIADYDDQRINKVRPEQGAWPPPDHEILIERSGLELTGAQVGEMLLIKAPNGTERRMRMAGLAHDLYRPPAFLDGNIYGYVTFDTLEWLGEPRDYNELYVRIDEAAHAGGEVRSLADAVERKVRRSDRAVYQIQLPDPAKHPLSYIVETISLLLSVLGITALLMSGFLVINTISALLAQQIRQIGIMKAIGARTFQILAMYFGMVVVFGVAALIVAIPLALAGARVFADFTAGLLNFDITTFRISARVLAIEAAVAIVVPVLSALVPVLAGTRVTVRDAISSQGQSSASPGRGLIDALIMRIRFFSRPVLLSLRNTFRRRGRLALTLITLTLGGSIFIAVFSVRSGLMQTLDDLLRLNNFDIWVTLDRPRRIAQMQRELLQVPGVVEMEGWGFTSVRRERPDGSDSATMILFAPPATSTLVQPTLVRGRWLLPEDEDAVVISTNILRDEPDIEMGETIVLNIEGKEYAWTIVGIFQSSGPTMYVNYDYYTRLIGEAGRARVAMIVTSQHDVEAQIGVARQIEARFDRAGFGVTSVLRMAEEGAEVTAAFNIIVGLLLFMALLTALVGGLGLMGTISLNVIERTREIGIMRSIGASNWAILSIVMVEGIFIGVLSWGISALLAIPVGSLLGNAVGLAFLNNPLAPSYSPGGAVLWLGLVVIITMVASLLPARAATRLTIREVLAYE
jgi:putative ABC transport system permease protein